MITNIYVLICPLDGQAKYIGKSNNPERRLRDHMTDFRTEYNKGRWIRMLKHQKLKPILEVIDEVSIDNWQYWEQWWIEYFKSLGIKLLNYNKGGNGLSVGNHNTFKAGNKPKNKKENA
jgi:hypothetical protein